MSLPRFLRQKSEKLALSFEYVQDRYAYLPGYGEMITFFGKSFLLGCFLFLLVFTSDIWVSTLRYGVQRLWPDPAPPVTITASVRDTNLRWMPFLREQWDTMVRQLPVINLTAIQRVPDFVQNNQDIFTVEISPQFAEMRQVQAAIAQELKGIDFAAGGMARNVTLPFLIQEETIPSRLGAEIALLKRLKNFNEVRTRDFLDTSIDRAATMEEFLLRGRNLQQSSARVLNSISARHDRAQLADQNLQNQANAEEQEFLSNLSAFLVSKTEQSFAEFVEVKQRTVTSRAEAGFLNILEQNFAQELVVLQQKLSAAEANKEALIANVTVTVTPGVDLGLIKQ